MRQFDLQEKIGCIKLNIHANDIDNIRNKEAMA